MKMKKTVNMLVVALMLLCGQLAFGQNNKQKALDKGNQAIKLEDEGKVDEAIKLLEESQKLDPDNIDYPYELAYAYYAKKEYKKAAKFLEGILKDKNVYDRVYQLLGNCYDNMGKSDEAIETYAKGLELFPNSGSLYLESGIVQMGKKDYNKALSYYEKGIQVNPEFPSNYYWAARIFCNSQEEVWGMIYGEIFMNLERNSKRTEDISKLLYDTYKSEIKFTSDTSFTVSFSQTATMNIDDLKDPSKAKLPFGIGVYEPTLMLSMINEKSIDLASLDRIRKNFLDNYFHQEKNKQYPNILFDYQKKIADAGHFEAYNHWLLLKGDEQGFEKWQTANKDKWDNFIKWYTENAIKVDGNHKFYRAQY